MAKVDAEEDQATAKPLILFDAEDGIEEKGWVASADAPSPAVAERLLEEKIGLETGSAYLCEGRGWYRCQEKGPIDIELWESCKHSDPEAVCFWEVLLIDAEEKFPPSEKLRTS